MQDNSCCGSGINRYHRDCRDLLARVIECSPIRERLDEIDRRDLNTGYAQRSTAAHQQKRVYCWRS